MVLVQLGFVIGSMLYSHLFVLKVYDSPPPRAFISERVHVSSV